MSFDLSLTADQASWLLDNIQNPLVKVEPRARGGHCTYGRAKLVSVNAKRGTATILPFGHKQLEEMELIYLRKWNSKYDGAEIPEPKKPDGPLRVPLIDVSKFAPPKMKEENMQLVETKPEKNWEEHFKKRWNDSDVEEVYKLRQMGKSVTEIAKIIGTSRSNAYVMMAKAKKMFESKVKISEGLPLPITPKIEKRISSDSEKLVDALRTILTLKLPDGSKLMAIEALLSDL